MRAKTRIKVGISRRIFFFSFFVMSANNQFKKVCFSLSVLICKVYKWASGNQIKFNKKTNKFSSEVLKNEVSKGLIDFVFTCLHF